MNTETAIAVEAALGQSGVAREEAIDAIANGDRVQILQDYLELAAKEFRDRDGNCLWAIDELGLESRQLATVLRPAFFHPSCDYRDSAAIILNKTGEEAPVTPWSAFPNSGSLGSLLCAIGGTLRSTPRPWNSAQESLAMGGIAKGKVPWIVQWISFPSGTFSHYSGYTFAFDMSSCIYDTVSGAPSPGPYVAIAYDEMKQVHLCLSIDDPSDEPDVHVVDHESWYRERLEFFQEFLAVVRRTG